jgi:hypothetical protein
MVDGPVSEAAQIHGAGRMRGSGQRRSRRLGVSSYGSSMIGSRSKHDQATQRYDVVVSRARFGLIDSIQRILASHPDPLLHNILGPESSRKGVPGGLLGSIARLPEAVTDVGVPKDESAPCQNRETTVKRKETDGRQLETTFLCLKVIASRRCHPSLSEPHVTALHADKLYQLITDQKPPRGHIRREVLCVKLHALFVDGRSGVAYAKSKICLTGMESARDERQQKMTSFETRSEGTWRANHAPHLADDRMLLFTR